MWSSGVGVELVRGFEGGDRGGEVGEGTGVASGAIMWLPSGDDKAPQPVRRLD